MNDQVVIAGMARTPQGGLHGDLSNVPAPQLGATAIRKGKFKEEIKPVVVKTRKGEITVDTDEQPGKARIDKIPTLKPAFAKDGTVTPANSSSISDGAAAVVLLKESGAVSRDLTPLAVLHTHATHAQEPGWFTTAPVGAIKKVLDKTGWTVDDVDLFEVNEAFAVVAMAAMHDLQIPHDKLNVNSGACALDIRGQSKIIPDPAATTMPTILL